MSRSPKTKRKDGEDWSDIDLFGDKSLMPNEHGENWLPDIWMLEQSSSSKEFYKRLSELILKTGSFSDEERHLLAEQASIPWKRFRGRPRQDKRNHEIFMNYFFDGACTPDDQPRELPSRKEAITLIMKEYNLDAEAAAKAYNQARKSNGQAPSIERVKR